MQITINYKSSSIAMHPESMLPFTTEDDILKWHLNRIFNVVWTKILSGIISPTMTFQPPWMILLQMLIELINPWFPPLVSPFSNILCITSPDLSFSHTPLARNTTSYSLLTSKSPNSLGQRLLTSAAHWYHLVNFLNVLMPGSSALEVLGSQAQVEVCF